MTNGLFGGDFDKVLLNSPAYWREHTTEVEIEMASIKRASRSFVGSMMDFNGLEGRGWHERFWSRVRITPHIVYMILSKIPERYPEILPPDWGEGYPNVWIWNVCPSR